MKRFFLAAAWGFVASGVARADLALEFSIKDSPPKSYPNQPLSVGWSFTMNRAVTVVALDAAGEVDQGGSDVRLYNGLGTVLASAIIMNTDPTVGSPTSFLSHAITPVTLAAGRDLLHRRRHLGVREWVFYARCLSDDRPRHNLRRRGANRRLGQDPISDSPGNSGLYPGYFGPDFEIVPAAAVPEPPSLALVVLSGATLMGYARCRRRSWIRGRSID